GDQHDQLRARHRAEQQRDRRARHGCERRDHGEERLGGNDALRPRRDRLLRVATLPPAPPAPLPQAGEGSKTKAFLLFTPLPLVGEGPGVRAPFWRRVYFSDRIPSTSQDELSGSPTGRRGRGCPPHATPC